jgi:hypothetical protein
LVLRRWIVDAIVGARIKSIVCRWSRFALPAS